MSASTPADYQQLMQRVRSNLGKLAGHTPALMKGYAALAGAAFGDGALDRKTKELIAIGIAIAARCEECIGFHVNDALKAGATRQEVAEALGVAVLMGGGPALMYVSHALDALEQLSPKQS